jgi:4-amino-4-deoxy-L-arabinose transferase-like glycosyltransferase
MNASGPKAVHVQGAIRLRGPSALQTLTPYLALFGVWLVLFAIGVTGYPNLLDNERRIGAYALDVMQNGHWVAQHDSTGQFMSKPPGLTWLVVLASYCSGGLSRFSLYLPSALATLGVALLIFQAGCRFFTERAAFIAAFAYLFSYVTEKQLTTARYDGLFTLPVFLGALALYRGWKEGRGWLVFWLSMTFGAMVKGPLVFILPLFGLLAVFLEKHTGRLFSWNWRHALGFAIFAAVCGSWLALVLHYHGDEFTNKILRRELVGHALNDGGKHWVGERFYLAPLEVLIQFLPWSPVAILAALRMLRRGKPEDGHSFERYLSCYFIGGLILFSVAAHQRGRLTWPLIPALALLAGRQLDIWFREISTRRLRRWALRLGCATIIASALNHYWFMRYSKKCQQTLAFRDLAELLRREAGENPPVVYVDAPFAVQFYLSQFRYNVSVPAAAELLESSNRVLVVSSGSAALRITEATAAIPFVLYSWPGDQPAIIEILSNRPTFAR